MSISALGTGSGLPLADLVDQLVEAEGLATSLRLDRQNAKAETLISAFGLLKVGLSTFQSSLGGLSSVGSFESRTATSSAPDQFSATVDKTAAPGAFAVEVINPGLQHRISSNTLKDASNAVIEDINTSLGGGTLVFTQNNETFSVTIDPSASTLKDIRDAINQSSGNTGLAASLINTGNGIAFVLTAAKTGTDNSFTITVDDADGQDVDGAGLSQLFFDPASLDYNAALHLGEDQAAEDAQILLDGQTVTSTDGSVFKDVVQGVTITALAVTEKEERVTVGLNTEAVRGQVTSLVSAYNQLAATFRQLNSYNSETGNSSVLFADPLVRGAETQLRRFITQQVSGNPAGFRSLNDIGLRFNDQGELTLDSAALSKALSGNIEAVGVLFASDGTAENIQNIVATGLFDDSSTVVGEGQLTISVGDDSFTIDVSNANANDTVATLRDAINNAVDNAGVTASLQSQDDGAGGTDVRLVLTSNDSGLANRILVSTDDSDGNDVNDSGLSRLASENLVVLQDFTQSRPEGIISQLRSFLDGFLGSNGAIRAREDGLNKELKEVVEQREILDRRLISYKDRIVAKFAALDSIVSQLNQTSSFLQQQFANISQIAKPRNSN